MESLKNLQYTPQKNFRDGVMTAGIIVLFIALIGLVGYVNDEINRRHKEIAIRKVNGARVRDILNIFQRDIMKTASPAVIVGAVAAYAGALRQPHHAYALALCRHRCSSVDHRFGSDRAQLL